MKRLTEIWDEFTAFIRRAGGPVPSDNEIKMVNMLSEVVKRVHALEVHVLQNSPILVYGDKYTGEAPVDKNVPAPATDNAES